MDAERNGEVRGKLKPPNDDVVDDTSGFASIDAVTKEFVKFEEAYIKKRRNLLKRLAGYHGKDE